MIPRRSILRSRNSIAAAAAFTPTSLLTIPEMKPYIGSYATSSAASTASHSLRGASSRASRNVNSTTSAPSSAEVRRISVSCEKIEARRVSRYAGDSAR